MKYRYLIVNTEMVEYPDDALYPIDTAVIQVKKWFKWITIKTIEGEPLKVEKYCKRLIKLLNTTYA